jgi:hypothetical protein
MPRSYHVDAPRGARDGMARESEWQEGVRAAHAACVDRHVGAAPFDPASSAEGSEYNFHHLDVDTTQKQDEAFWPMVGGRH